MPAQVFDIQALGFDRARSKLARVGFRLRDARPAFEVISEMLEEGEKRLFKRYRGKYVDTGALMESLTQPNANDAIREAHAGGLDFGTAVYYARFHKDKKGKSAVLKLQPTERKKIPTTLLEYVVAGFEGRL
jgi:hypothetical protein